MPTTQECPRCIGKGLIGQGPSPHLLQGRKETCPDCKGTGRVSLESGIGHAQGTQEAPAVDNSSNYGLVGGILKKLFKR